MVRRTKVDDSEKQGYRIDGWQRDYKQIKRMRWLRNRLVHDTDSFEDNFVNIEDIEWLHTFYNRIMECTDPFSLLYQSKNMDGKADKQEKDTDIILPIDEASYSQNEDLSDKEIYPSAWEINHSYIIKVYDDKKKLERNIKISEILLECAIPVAKTVPTKTGEKYVKYKNTYFLMSKKLKGSNISDMKDKTIAWQMGCAIAQLHMAFIKCEKEFEFLDNSLLKEMKGWIRENLINNDWKMLNEEEYSKTVQLLESVYDYLPKQLIHRDVHCGNFLFFEGNLSGYIDFDLCQRNIRIFDICYFLKRKKCNSMRDGMYRNFIYSVFYQYE